jgi:GH15 family glucan-1,4-alpha-glucosidase
LTRESGSIPSIEEYALIGNGRSVALVSRAASIDWLCWPRFDSPAIFGALLDDAAGRWRIAPRGSFQSSRRYLGHTNVLQTTFSTATGVARVTDFMPVSSEAYKQSALVPDHEIARIIECDRGRVELDLIFAPRPNYARTVARIREAGRLGIRVELRPGFLSLRTDIPLEPPRDGVVSGRTTLHAGETQYCSLTYADDGPAIVPPLGAWTRDAVRRSIVWWEDWIARATYDGPGREAVLRSALVLKLLGYAPSGAIVAAATTSLPERVGGDLNWDYRFCWLRDASLTVRALLGLGFTEEAEAFVSWLLHATRLTRPALGILYDVYGRIPAPEQNLAHLAGYRGSVPVRINNDAAAQFQLDVYGEVIDAVAHIVDRGGTLDRSTQRMLRAFGAYICRHWRQPDEGIWEPRSGRRHHTHSRVLCWTALDRLLELHEKGFLGGAAVEALRTERESIRVDVETRAWNAELGAYTAQLDGDQVDASLLRLPWYGFEEAASERMRNTYRRVRERLGAGNGLLYRYRDGESPGEGAFGICGFWAAEYLALGGGSVREAEDLFLHLVGYANDVGLFAEEIDPDTGGALGNFPQAFTHIGLINAALSLARRRRARQPVEGVHEPDPGPSACSGARL